MPPLYENIESLQIQIMNMQMSFAALQTYIARLQENKSAVQMCIAWGHVTEPHLQMYKEGL